MHKAKAAVLVVIFWVILNWLWMACIFQVKGLRMYRSVGVMTFTVIAALTYRRLTD